MAGALEPTAVGAPWVASAARVAEAFRRAGVDGVGALPGEFVAWVFERRTRNLHVFRDPSGMVPLYWVRGPKRFAFATELPPLLTLPWVSRELARDHLAEYLSFRVVHAPRTLMRDVAQLAPGTRLRFDADGVRVHATSQVRYAAPGTPVPRESDVVPELTAAIERATRRRLAGETEVGVYLSGGVGSAAVTAAARAASRSLRTFTVTFAEERSPESPFAGRVARLFGMEHSTVVVGTREVAEGFDAAVAALGHPNGNVAAVLQLRLAQAAASHVGRVLTGDGADQLFGGAMLQEPARGLARVLAYQRVPLLARDLLSPWLSRTERFADLALPADRWARERGLGGVLLCDERVRRQLLLDGLYVRPRVRQEVLAPFYDEVDTDPLNGMMHAFYRSQLGSDILVRTRMTAAAAGLAVTSPLLDREVVRLAMLLPGAFKLRGLSADASTRWLLRALLKGQMPPALVNRPDRVMARPLDDWLIGPGRLFLEDRFDRLREDTLGLWHHTGLEAIRRGLSAGRAGAAHRLWALFALDAWVRAVKAT
jgi:asparagine synthase (glutamine-hydrolysing)